MKFYILLITVLVGSFGFSQDLSKEQLKADKNATNLVYKANELVSEDNYVEAEMEYRKAISEAPNKATGAYNLAHSYYKKGSFDEALFRSQEAANNATTKDEKHRAFHNIGNILMQNKQCKQAVEAYKNALRNNPLDEESRYNFALAKECADQQKDDGGGEDDKKDENKDDEQNKEDEQKKDDDNKDDKDKKDDQDKKDEGDKDKKDGDKDKDEDGKPKDDKKDDGKGKEDNKDNNQQPKPKPGQMSPQQIKNILEAMQNQEQKVQEKMNAEKQKGAKVKTDKDW
ncbi:tetratricopeptide repeat protein [Winogradskyella thalassocola]|uniref:Tetratricopeptide repeat-containing protein n=1 Tax=Winogradskyella thalassocola TaxID=262004 RepID=A0A1G7XJY5_9FLAO|nr:tetratricopeptide repeat protein [Winogradskyella thalassocola]SDG84416.1 Tetratricopeptide repeat-containing protein [Winogradskyella thalassocola]